MRGGCGCHACSASVLLFVAAGIVVLIILSVAAAATVGTLTVVIGTSAYGGTGTTRGGVAVIGGAGAFVRWLGGALGALAKLHYFLYRSEQELFRDESEWAMVAA